jgi:hypothetical protein
MNRIFSALLVCIISFSTFLGFTQQASAEGHVYLNLEEIQCPDIGDGDGSGYFRYALSWKSEDEVPSPPEANEYRRFFPAEVSQGDCRNNTKVIKVNQKFKFPVDRNILVLPAVGDGNTPLQPFVIPATQNLEGTETVFTDNNGYKSVIKYKVTFE